MENVEKRRFVFPNLDLIIETYDPGAHKLEDNSFNIMISRQGSDYKKLNLYIKINDN